MRWDIRGHAHGNAGGAIEQHMGHLSGQHGGLLQSAIKVGHPVYGSLPHLLQQQLGERGQTRLGVAHGGKGLGIIN